MSRLVVVVLFWIVNTIFIKRHCVKERLVRHLAVSCWFHTMGRFRNPKVFTFYFVPWKSFFPLGHRQPPLLNLSPELLLWIWILPISILTCGTFSPRKKAFWISFGIFTHTGVFAFSIPSHLFVPMFLWDVFVHRYFLWVWERCEPFVRSTILSFIFHAVFNLVERSMVPTLGSSNLCNSPEAWFKSFRSTSVCGPKTTSDGEGNFIWDRWERRVRQQPPFPKGK